MIPSISTKDLPGDLPSLINRYAKEVFQIHRIDGLFIGDPDLHGATYCIIFADETRLKARFWRRGSDLQFQTHVHERLSPERFTRILFQSDQSTIENWIDGETIGDSKDTSMTMEAGRLLGLIHETPPPDLSTHQNHKSIEEYESELIVGLDQLTSFEFIDLPFAKQVHNAAMAAKPGTAEVGLIHRDFCGENLVLSNNLVCSIDNTTFALGPFDIDLARTWYRWRMPAEQWTAFLEGYSQHRDDTFFRKHGFFWKASVLVQATLMRFRAGLVEQSMVPVNRLRELCS